MIQEAGRKPFNSYSMSGTQTDMYDSKTFVSWVPLPKNAKTDAVLSLGLASTCKRSGIGSCHWRDTLLRDLYSMFASLLLGLLLCQVLACGYVVGDVNVKTREGLQQKRIGLLGFTLLTMLKEEFGLVY